MKKIARGQITITALYDGEPGPQGPQGPQGEPGTPGADGSDGSDGSDGVSVEVRNAPLVFDTDATGLVPSSALAAQTAQVRLMAGGRNITGAVTSYASDNAGSRLCQSATTRTVSGGDAYLSVRLTAITAQTTEAGTASAMAGYARVRIAHGGTNYYAQVPFQVNVAKMTGALMANTTQLRAEYTALRGDLGSSSPATLQAYTTALTQNAEKIALSASRNAVGRRNLLPGTALTMRKGAPAIQLYQQNSVYDYSGIQHHPSKDGMNCLRVVTSHPTADSYQYAGLYWRGGDGGGNIRIEQGKKYTLSVWVMANTTAVGISLEAYAKESESSMDRLGTNIAKVSKWSVAKAGEWELFTAAIDTTGLGHDYLEVVTIAVSQTVGLTATAYFCQPQLAEGDTATPWTPSTKDGDRLGGNLLDDTLSLTPTLTGSNLMYANGVTPQVYEGTHATAHAESTAEGSLAEIMQFDVGGKISQGEDYVFSFLARGSGMICAYLYYAPDGSPMVMRETVDGEVALLGDGAAYFQLSAEWKRYWVHWRTLATAQPHYLLLRAWNVCQATICQPKLEEAATMTPYTERGTDLVSRAEAKRAGMELTADGILLYGERIQVRNTVGDLSLTAALFENGRLNANLIIAEMLSTTGRQGQRVQIAGGLMNIYGSNGAANIRFGVNTSGQAVLSYYDDAGNFLYDLGPSGIAQLSKEDRKLTAVQFVSWADAGITSPLGENKSYAYGSGKTHTWYTATQANDRIIFGQGISIAKTTTFYQYRAPRVNGKIVADGTRGLTTYALTEAADGKWFKSGTVLASGGALTNLVTGSYIVASAKAVDRSKWVPGTGKRGDVYVMPTHSFTGFRSFLQGVSDNLLGCVYSRTTYTYIVSTDINAGILDSY